MKELPETIGPFETWDELKLVIEALTSKYGYERIASMERYKNTGIHGTSHRTLALRNNNTLRSGLINETTMTFKKFKYLFIAKPLSFKPILRIL